MSRRLWIVTALVLWTASLSGQESQPLPQALTQMIEAERAFAARALVIGWKQAFLEYFAQDALAFEEGKVGLAREQLLKAPDPPPDAQLIWEPRFGDMSGSGDLGYLTGTSAPHAMAADRDIPATRVSGSDNGTVPSRS